MPKKNNQKNKQKGGFFGLFESKVDASGNPVTAAPEPESGGWFSFLKPKPAAVAAVTDPAAVAPAAGPAAVTDPAAVAPAPVAPTTNVAGEPSNQKGGRKRNKSKKSKKSKKNRSKKH